MHNSSRNTWLVLLLLSVIACTSTKDANTSTAEGNLTARKLVDHMTRNQVRADWMEAKARISYDGEDRKASASTTIIIRKDSLIWLSIRKFGVEVARAQIDKDSVYLINRFAKEYTIKELDYLSDTYNLPASLPTIEAIFLGNPVFLNRKDMELGQDGEQLHLVSSSGNLENQFWLAGMEHILVHALYGDLRERREVELFLEDYRPLDAEQKFSYLRQIKIDSRELGKANLKVDFSKVKINVPQDIRFSIPPHYTRVD